MRAGRRKEFEAAYAAAAKGEHAPPDPLSERTFRAAKLDWDEPLQPEPAKRRQLVQRMLECRARYVTPHLANMKIWSADASADGAVLSAKWQLDGGALHLLANLGDFSALADPPPGEGCLEYHARAHVAAMDGVLDVEGLNAARDPARDLPPAAVGQVRLRWSGRRRSLPEGARHRPSLCVALSEGAGRLDTGYDIIDHNVLNPEFGGEEGFARLSRALADADMGLILDFVPNHMGVGHADNAWWLDVLEWGPKSPFASIFDISWDALPYRPHGGLLLPILGKPYGEVLEQGEIILKFDAEEGSFSFWYFDHRLPVRPDRYSEIINKAVGFAAATGG